MYYILQNKIPIKVDIHTYHNWLGNKRVAFTEVAPDIRVSTVFLGTDHSFGDGDYDPVLFESMCFYAGREFDCVRYRTWDEAEKGHYEIVNRLKFPFDYEKT